MEEMQFAFGVDEDFAPYAGILMTSIVLNHPGEPVAFHLVAAGLKPEDQQRFDTFTRLYRNTRIFIYDAAPLLERLPSHSADKVPKRLNTSMFLRLFLPEILPPEIGRVVYLDADMLCIGRLDALWRTELGTAALAAVPYDADEAQPNCQLLGLKGKQYFNSGCLLIPPALWRERQIMQRLLALCREHWQEFLMPDQDAMNMLFADEPGAVQLQPHVQCVLPAAADTGRRGCTAAFCQRGKALVSWGRRTGPEAMGKLQGAFPMVRYSGVRALGCQDDVLCRQECRGAR